MKLIIIAGTIGYAVFCIASFIYCKTTGKFFKRFFHDILGWHIVSKKDKCYYDGCNVHGKCVICGKEVMQDSQGNWF